MSPEEFKQRWIALGGDLLIYLPERLQGLNLKETTIDFLINAGLPRSAAPFLGFNADEINRLTKIYDLLESEFDRYIAIGADGSGNPIVINIEQTDQIELLDHENDFSKSFFNTSISQLAECLVAYREFVQSVIKENGQNAFMHFNFTDAQYETVKERIQSADNKAIAEDGFWKEELRMAPVMRDYYRKENKR